MILVSAIRFLHSAWVEARAMHREALKRFPFLRQD